MVGLSGPTLGEERFEQIVVATGRYHKPSIPDVPGLQSFSGTAGVNHTFSYKRPEDYRGLRVLVGGCAISSVEIASDLASAGRRAGCSHEPQAALCSAEAGQRSAVGPYGLHPLLRVE